MGTGWNLKIEAG